jgi:hypothetical protein
VTGEEGVDNRSARSTFETPTRHYQERQRLHNRTDVQYMVADSAILAVSIPDASIDAMLPRTIATRHGRRSASQTPLSSRREAATRNARRGATITQASSECALSGGICGVAIEVMTIVYTRTIALRRLSLTA